MIRDAASEAQVQAANPQANTWLSANAGSGKTRVLTDRVARLLLAGVQPQHILCLTYTKAAAREMQNRLFNRLGEWAMKPDAELLAALADLGDDGRFATGALASARQLFARAIETPGGLRIQTIHSFCGTLLRRFPLEAGVSPQFREMDDRAARILREQIVQELAATDAPELMAEVAQHYSGEDFFDLMEQIAQNRAAFAKPKSAAQIKTIFGLAADESYESLLKDALLGNEAWLRQEMEPILRAGSANDKKLADKLAALDFESANSAVLAELESFLLFGADAKAPFSAKKDSIPTKDTRANLGPLLDQFNALMLRVEAARPRRLALNAAQKATALHRFAAAFLPRYSAAKTARGYLDFDDLITYARALLTSPEVAAWVLFRLDGGIDHILVDEAQDTSPLQWDVIKLLSAEFTAGQGTHSADRTLFVVGDKKQSIYSFQGADVAAFDENRHGFHTAFQAANQRFEIAELQYSFRSSPAILRVVDETFGGRFPTALGDLVQHIAFKDDMPGRVDLWPIIEKTETQNDEHWEDPIDLISETHHMARLADSIAAEIAAMIESGTQIPEGKSGQCRPVHAGDFLILVQRRGDAFDEIIRACKQANLPIAGADRMNLGSEMAVRDLAALLSFLDTQDDDLSLAAFLRSPLAGWTEAELFDLAHSRTGFLWESLRRHASHADTLAMLTDMRDQTDYLRPYELIERVLTRHDGRRRLIARLGHEAEDGIDELLTQALAYEQNETPSLTGFLIWLQSGEITVKRQVDGAGARIRVMTVHGAKGLEAPIVILPDTADRNLQDHDEVFILPGNTPIWKTNKENDTAHISEVRSARAQKATEESLRLLYVALTRARSWLIIAGAGTNKKPDAWYNLVSQGMEAAGAIDLVGGTKRFAFGDWPPDAEKPADLAISEPHFPDWAQHPAPDAAHPPPLISPSGLGGAKVMVGESGSDVGAALRGTALHLLLEHLPQHPPADWPRISERLVPDADQNQGVFAEAISVLTQPHLAHIFAASTLSEVAVTSPLFAGQMLGAIDRLIISDTHVLAVDFKSNRIVPQAAADVPAGLLRQMGAYAAALAQIYPNHVIQTAILWTATAQLMPLDNKILQAELNKAATS